MPPSGRNMNPEVGGEGGGRRRRGRGRREILAGGWWQRAPNLAKRRRKRGRGGKNWERATMAHFWRASLNDPNDVVLLARYEQMGWSPPQLQRTHPHTHTPPLHTHTHTHTRGKCLEIETGKTARIAAEMALLSTLRAAFLPQFSCSLKNESYQSLIQHFCFDWLGFNWMIELMAFHAVQTTLWKNYEIAMMSSVDFMPPSWLVLAYFLLAHSVQNGIHFVTTNECEVSKSSAVASRVSRHLKWDLIFPSIDTGISCSSAGTWVIISWHYSSNRNRPVNYGVAGILLLPEPPTRGLSHQPASWNRQPGGAQVPNPATESPTRLLKPAIRGPSPQPAAWNRQSADRVANPPPAQ